MARITLAAFWTHGYLWCELRWLHKVAQTLCSQRHHGSMGCLPTDLRLLAENQLVDKR